MKKSIIAAGAASVALAAMPIVGVFADDDPVVEQGIVKDTVTVNVNSTCSVTSAGTLGTTTAADDTINRSVNFGTMSTATSRESSDESMTTAPVSFTINCNGPWHVTAKGAGTTGNEQNLYKAAGTGEDTSPAATISGTASTGSYWKFMVTGTNTVAAFNADYVSIPNTTGSTVASSSEGVSNNAITPAYKINLTGSQTPGIYEGGVSYTLTTGAGA